MATGLTASAVAALDPDLGPALRVDGAGGEALAWELLRAARTQVLVAVAAAFGRAVSEVGASPMVGGNVLGQRRAS
ncbi:MAG TPA: hypothetical protein VFX49_18495 [Chloroflexota bacterium]|nr:hypothetical protein [Chloroflexota bacterium]